MAVKPGFKQTEVGVIPEDWCIKPCSALSDLITVGIVIRPAQYYVRQGVLALRSANIRENKIDEAEMVFISEKANTLLSKSQLRTGDVLTVRTGYPGTSAVVTQNFAGSNCIDILITRPSKGVSSKYLSAWINSPFGKYQVLRNQGGLAQQHFNVADLRNLVVALPPTLHEQQAIAEALSDVDGLISAVDALIAKKRAIKQGAMQELLTGQRRLPGFAGEWVVKILGEVAEITKLAGFEYTNYFNSYNDGGDIVVIRGTNITNNRLDLSDVKTIPRSVSDKLPRSKLQKNDLVFAYVGTIGPVYLIDENDKYHLGPNTARITVNKDILPQFAFCYFTSEFVKNEIVEHTSTGAQPSLSMSKIRKFKIRIPPLTEQTAIAQILADMDAEIAALMQKRDKTVALKQGMMQSLLTGQVRLV